MLAETARQLAQLSDLTRRAREVDWQDVDRGNAVFQSSLGHVDALAEAGSLTVEAADRQQRDLIHTRRALLESMVAAGHNWHYRNIAPAPELSPQQQATAVLESAREVGVEIIAHRDGALSIAPVSKLTTHLRESITQLRAHIVLALRSDTLTIPAPKHRPA